MQQTLVESTLAEQGRLEPFRYIPALKTLPGELEALARADITVWARTTPLVEIATRVGDKAESSAQRLLPHLAERASSGLGPHLFFLDSRWLSTATRIVIKQGAHKREVNGLEHLLATFCAAGLLFVPVVRLNAGPKRLEILRGSLDLDARGVCVRVLIADVILSSGNTLGRALQVLVDRVGVGTDRADLVLDLGYIEQEPGFAADDIARLLNKLEGLKDWRSVVLLGTTMPSTLGVIPEQTVGELRRHEWLIWRDLLKLDVPRQLSFGDYAVQHPDRPPATGPGMRANLRYTVPNRFVIARGTQVTIDGWSQYRELASKVVARKDFSGPSYSWGDQEIWNCAEGLAFKRWSPYWRGVSTSHHLRFICEALDRAARK